jgi:hypothetical protein
MGNRWADPANDPRTYGNPQGQKATLREYLGKVEIAAADEWLDALGEDDLGRTVPLHGDTVSIRDVVVHVIEEYARHAGHADLLRECIDGRTGQ